MTRRERAPVEISFAEEKLDWFAFRVYVYAFWAVAAARTESRPKLRKMRERLLALLHCTPAVGPITAKAPATYDPNEQQVFLNPSERERATGLKGDSARLYFAPYRDFAKLVHSYGDAHAPGVHLDLSTIDPIDRNHLRDFGWIMQTVPDRGAIVVDSNDNGASLWITTDRKTAGFSKGAGYPASEYLPVASAGENWLDRVQVGPVKLTASFAREALSLLVEHHDLPVPAPREDADLLIIDATSRRSDLSKGFREHSRPYVWVFTRNEKVTLRQCRQLNATRLRHVIIVTQDVILELLRLYPWLWNKYIDAGGNVEIIAPGDSQRLGAALLGSWTIETYEEFLLKAEEAGEQLASIVRELCMAISATHDPWYDLWKAIQDEFRGRKWRILDDLHTWVSTRVRVEPPDIDVDRHAESGSYRSIAEPEAYARLRTRFRDHIVARYRRILFPVDVSLHRERMWVRMLAGPTLAVQGSSGSGRSTLAFGAARELGTAYIVIGGRTMRPRTVLAAPDDLDRIRAILLDPALQNMGWTIVVDQLELEVGRPPADTTLARVIALADRINLRTPERVQVITTTLGEHSSPESSQTYGCLHGRVISTRPFDPSFLGKLLDRWISFCDVTLSAELRGEMIERIIRQQMPLVRLIARLRITERTTVTQPLLDDFFDTPYNVSLWGP